jgi:deoxyadenosine/deoxycytidine kinase
MNYGNLIWVEGIIGAGKSTFSKEVGKRLNLRVIEEPVGNGEGIENPYLEKFYKDPGKYGFSMQIFLLHQRFAMQQLASYEATNVGGYKGAILDRSLSGDRVFAKMLMQDGFIDPLDFQTYEMAYSIMCRSLLPPTLLVYLDVQPQTAFDRMKSRNRKAEAGVPLDYLVKLRKGYLELLKEAESALLPWAHAVRILRIPFDFNIHSPEEWDAVALTVKDSCRKGNDTYFG